MDEDCPFCNLSEERLLHRGRYVSALFSFWPVSDYHLLIVPNRHVTAEKELEDREVLDLHELRMALTEIIERKTGLANYNLGLNQGMLAGQTVPHIHYHVIFRSAGDVEDPTGGVRNIIPGMGNYKGGPVQKREEEGPESFIWRIKEKIDRTRDEHTWLGLYEIKEMILARGLRVDAGVYKKVVPKREEDVKRWTEEIRPLINV